MMPSSSMPSGRRSASGTARSPACIRSTCPRTSCARWPPAPASTPAAVDDVIWGCVTQVGEQTFDLARTAVLAAGWPDTIPGVTIDRQCGSSQQAVHFAAAGLIAGQYDAVVAGGVESMSRVPMGASLQVAGSPFAAAGWRARYGDVMPTQGVSSEMVAQRWGLSRAELDEFSLALAREGRCGAGLGARSTPRSCRCPRLSPAAPTSRRTRACGAAAPSTRSARCGPRSRRTGWSPPGNSSQISDGVSGAADDDLGEGCGVGARPRSPAIHTTVLAADDPIIMLTAPIPATRKALARSGLRLDEIGVFEVNEAFATVPLAWLREMADGGRDSGLEKALNPLGGAIALGHPLGASGARIMTTLVHHLRATGARYGLQTMCEGGGQANATIVERL